MEFDLNRSFRDFFSISEPKSDPKSVEKRNRYQEALVGELLRTLVSVGTLTKDEAQGVISRAKESAK